MTKLLNVVLHAESDLIVLRRYTRYVIELLGLDAVDQARIAAAIFALSQEIFRHALAPVVSFAVETQPAPTLRIVLKAGSNALTDYWSHSAEAEPHDGDNEVWALLTDFSVVTDATDIVLCRPLSGFDGDTWRARAEKIANLLTMAAATDVVAETARQNQELIQTLVALQGRHTELRELGRELEDTNRGVLALYAELDDKAVRLRQADAMKSRFLSNISHELRTPLGSIRALARILLQRLDGELSAEQEKQVKLIQASAAELTELVNDLLDLAKIEAGRVDVVSAVFSIPELFSALRGMMGPLLGSDAVRLHFDIEPGLNSLYSDETKVAQILRNFISNALKFTPAGDIRVKAVTRPNSAEVEFSVCDTGIGIALNHLELIFEEFAQIEHPLQQRVKGTGLGLPLCRQLAALLEGRIEVESTVGSGSTFRLLIPQRVQLCEDSDHAESMSRHEIAHGSRQS